jgi:hypothetical protein
MMQEEWRDLLAGLALVGLLASGERGAHLAAESYDYADDLLSSKDKATGIVSARKKRVPKQETA